MTSPRGGTCPEFSKMTWRLSAAGVPRRSKNERLRFVARLLEGEKMAPLCADVGISRKTGYKIFDRYKDCGLEALTDRSRRPYRQANRLPAPIEATIVRVKREHPGWGAPKIREKLRQQSPELPHCPAISTVHAVLDRHGQERSDQTRRGQCPAAAGALRCLCGRVQPRAAAPGPRHESARRPLRPLATAVPRP